MHFILSKLRDTLLLRVKSGPTDVPGLSKFFFLSFLSFFEVQSPFEVFPEQLGKDTEKMNESPLCLSSQICNKW